MFPQDWPRMAQGELLARMESPEGRFRREWHQYREIDRLKARLTQVRAALKVSTAQ
jgi:hypothetical protein